MTEKLTMKRGRRNNPRSWRARFLQELSLWGNVARACRMAKVSRTAAYHARETDAEFRAKWDEALEIACDGLEEEARRRAVVGVSGGAIFNQRDPISNSGGTLNVTTSTFTGNSAPSLFGPGGGGIHNIGDLAPATLINTILASNFGGNCDGTITSGGHNIDDGTTCGSTTANASLSNTNPQFDPAGLKDNGGPTQTIALLANSPAINAGDADVCATAPVNGLDQRGYLRPGTRVHQLLHRRLRV
jgi:hypothetical protein